MPERPTAHLVIAILAAGLAASSAAAKSGLEIAMPAVFGVIEAATYAPSGEQLGTARLEISELTDGKVRLLSHVALNAGAQTVAQALLAPTDSGRSLRLLHQESRSIDPEYNPLGVLSIDHQAGVATCSRTDADGESIRSLPLPDSDRVVNVPLNLLFSSLVEGREETVDFQLFVCRPRLYFVPFQARIERRQPATEGAPGLIEVRYEPRGGLVALIVRRFAPELAFWFDPDRPNPWIAHRLPLYSSGPDVVVVREGVRFERLQNGN